MYTYHKIIVYCTLIMATTIILAYHKTVFAQTGPSFDCGKASTAIEITICTNSNIASLDKTMADLYSLARKDPSINQQQLKADQVHFIKMRNSNCATSNNATNCLEREYQRRIAELQRLIGSETYSHRDSSLPAGTYSLDTDDGYSAAVKLECGSNTCEIDVRSESHYGKYSCQFTGYANIDSITNGISNNSLIPFTDTENNVKMLVSFNEYSVYIDDVIGIERSYYCGINGWLPLQMRLQKK